VVHPVLSVKINFGGKDIDLFTLGFFVISESYTFSGCNGFISVSSLIRGLTLLGEQMRDFLKYILHIP
jgi:hypothetical protein